MCSLGLLAYSRDVECLAESDGGIMVTLTLNFLTPSNIQAFKLHTVLQNPMMDALDLSVLLNRIALHHARAAHLRVSISLA
jgi:hypothetical protein